MRKKISVIVRPAQTFGEHSHSRNRKTMRPSQYILLAAMPVFISGFEQSLMATSAGSIAELAGVQNAMAFILAAYFLAASVTTLIFGRLGDAFGPMRMLVVALLIYVMGSLLASQANGFAWLIGARFIQGVGGGGMIALPQAFLAQRIAPRQRAAYQGYLVAVAFFANTFGPVFGG
jgi:MFS family permease